MPELYLTEATVVYDFYAPFIGHPVGGGGGQRAIKIKKFPLLDEDHIDEHQTTVNHLKLEEKEVAFIYFRYPKSTCKLKGKTEV